MGAWNRHLYWIINLLLWWNCVLRLIVSGFYLLVSFVFFFRYLSMKIVMQYDTPTSRTDKCISRLFTLYKEFISARSYEHQSHCSNFGYTRQNIWHKYSLRIIHVRDNPSCLNWIRSTTGNQWSIYNKRHMSFKYHASLHLTSVFID